MQFLGYVAQDFLVAANSVLEDAYAPETALIDVSINGARCDEVDYGYGFAFWP